MTTETLQWSKMQVDLLRADQQWKYDAWKAEAALVRMLPRLAMGTGFAIPAMLAPNKLGVGNRRIGY